jgi:hypothetical protein
LRAPLHPPTSGTSAPGAGRPPPAERTGGSLSRLSPGLFPPNGRSCALMGTATALPSCRRSSPPGAACTRSPTPPSPWVWAACRSRPVTSSS